jgi:hypothetical protein
MTGPTSTSEQARRLSHLPPSSLLSPYPSTLRSYAGFQHLPIPLESGDTFVTSQIIILIFLDKVD